MYPGNTDRLPGKHVQNAKLKAVALVLVLYAACKDSPTTPGKAGIVEVNPPVSSRSALANSVISPDIIVKLHDASGNPMVGQSVQFTAIGGGSLTGNAMVTTDASGQATAPVWRLSKSANGIGGQILRVKSGSLDSLDITATAASSFNIIVRFFDDANMTAGQKLLFTQAAARIQGVVTGDVPAVGLNQTDISGCLKQANGTTVLSETIDDLLIYATVKTMDGPGNVLASAGPCFVRVPGASPSVTDYTPVIGLMSFDKDDINSLTGPGGNLQDVITHEMLHVVGIGSLWACTGSPACRGFIDNPNTSNPLYNAPQARSGCVSVGGTTSCASKVPAEGCAGITECEILPNDSTNGAGTRDTHWRESTFDTELMTGFLDSANPFSSVTIGALADLGYTVNATDNDTYTIAAGSIRASSVRAAMPAMPTMRRNWEGAHSAPLYGIDRNGNVRLLKNTP
jgi:hypothetical protein